MYYWHHFIFYWLHLLSYNPKLHCTSNGWILNISVECPDGFIRGTYIACYKIFTDQKTWNDAAAECESLTPPAHLAIPDTTEVSKGPFRPPSGMNPHDPTAILAQFRSQARLPYDLKPYPR